MLRMQRRTQRKHSCSVFNLVIWEGILLAFKHDWQFSDEVAWSLIFVFIPQISIDMTVSYKYYTNISERGTFLSTKAHLHLLKCKYTFVDRKVPLYSLFINLHSMSSLYILHTALYVPICCVLSKFFVYLHNNSSSSYQQRVDQRINQFLKLYQLLHMLSLLT